MKQIIKTIKGFTLIELLITTALIAAVATYAVVVYPSFQVRMELESSTKELISQIKLARNRAVSGDLNLAHGVHLESDQFTVFRGDTFNVSDPANKVFELADVIEIANININDASANIIFGVSSGDILSYGDFEIRIKNGDARRVTVYISGIVEWDWI